MTALSVGEATERYRVGRYERREIAKDTNRSFRETLGLFAVTHVGREPDLCRRSRVPTSRTGRPPWGAD